MPTKTRSKRAAKAKKELATVPQQLAALKAMTISQLREVYLEVFGIPSRSRNKTYLYKKVAHGVQDREEPLSAKTTKRLTDLSGKSPKRQRSSGAKVTRKAEEKGRDLRLPEAGTVLLKEFKGDTHRVTVLADAFKFKGQTYRSLSKVAREITGTNWNGFLFFGLQRRGEKVVR